MPSGSYTVLIDWQNNGSFTGTGDDVTARMLRADFARGRDVDSQLTGKSVAGSMQLLINNQSGDYNSFRSAGPLYGSLLPGRLAQLRSASYMREVLSDKPAGYWRLGETTGTLAADSGPNALTGTIAGMTLNATGALSGDTNGAGSFGGNTGTGRVVIGHNTSLEFTGTSFTIEQWVYITDFISATSQDRAIFSKEVSGTGGWLLYRPQSGASGTGDRSFSFNVRAGGTFGAYLSTTGTLASGTWYHVVGLHDGTNRRIYLNGTQNNSTAFTGSIDTGTSVVVIGQGNTAGVDPFLGLIDEVAVYNTALSSARILAHYNASTYFWPNVILWQGYVERIIPKPSAKGLDTAIIECIGPLGFVNQKEISLGVLSTTDTGSAIGSVLDQAGWSTAAGYRDIDAGKTTMRKVFFNRKRTLDALRQIEVTEAGFIRESGSGGIVFENRHRRLTGTYQTSQGTFTDSATGTLLYMAVEQEDPLPFVFTEFVATVRPYTTSATGTLWKFQDVTSGTVATIAPDGGTRTIIATYPNASSTSNAIGVDTWITPTATTDWNIFDDSAGTGINLNGSSTIAVTKFATEMRIVLTNNSARIGYITYLQARGIPLIQLESALVVATSSGTVFGSRTYPSPSEFMPDANEGQDWANWNAALNGTPAVRFSMQYIANRSTAMVNQAMLREISDRITIIGTGTGNLGVARECYIEAVKHSIDGNRTHIVTYYLSDGTQLSDGWVMDTSELGTRTRLVY